MSPRGGEKTECLSSVDAMSAPAFIDVEHQCEEEQTRGGDGRREGSPHPDEERGPRGEQTIRHDAQPVEKAQRKFVRGFVGV